MSQTAQQQTAGDLSRSWSIKYFTAGGDVLDFNDRTRLIAQARHGFGAIDPVEQVTRGPRQDGDTLLGIYAKPRTLEVPTYIIGGRAQPMNSLRRRLSAAFNPLAGDGVLEYRDVQMGTTYTITVRPQGCKLDTMPKEGRVHLESFHWIAHLPWFYGPSIPQEILANGSRVRIRLNSDVAVPWVLSVPGPISNPTFRNLTTGTGITINTVIFPNETLQISSVFNGKSALAVSNLVPNPTRNLYPNRDLGSTYWLLQPGQNIVSLSANPTPASPVPGTLTYAPAFAGI